MDVQPEWCSYVSLPVLRIVDLEQSISVSTNRRCDTTLPISASSSSRSSRSRPVSNHDSFVIEPRFTSSKTFSFKPSSSENFSIKLYADGGLPPRMNSHHRSDGCTLCGDCGEVACRSCRSGERRFQCSIFTLRTRCSACSGAGFVPCPGCSEDVRMESSTPSKESFRQNDSRHHHRSNDLNTLADPMILIIEEQQQMQSMGG
mmetsp:Transcript_37419/g.60583  ORF Transcript_37419/g.60583 Transcript_37419/m.60583 type:complete len:203 (-) Transcript_37419:313-921(-)